MSQLTQNLTDNEIKFLKFQKERWFDAKTSFKKLQIARNQWKFLQNQETPKQNISWLDVWVKTWSAISNVWSKLKFQSKPDDWIIESSAKFAWNLPWSTLELWGWLVSAVSDPVWTGKWVKTLAETGIEAWLSKIFSTKVWQSILKKLWTPEENLKKVKEWWYFTKKENEVLAKVIWKEYDRVKNEPWRLKELIVESPADILWSVSWWAGLLSKVWQTWKLSTWLEKVSKATNPILLQKKWIEAWFIWPVKAKNFLFPQKSLDDIVMQVSQGKAKNLEPFKNALSQINIKTYNDLNNAFSEKIKAIAQKQDSLLPTDPKYSISDLSTTQGKRSVNYIEESIKDLEAVWKAENDLALLQKVDEIKDKEKLSVKDINDLARFYGTKFREKAFNKMWDPKSSVSAARFENNRTWIKTVSRDLLPDDTMRLLDWELANLYDAQKLSSKMVEKVDNLSKKIEDRWLIERFSRSIWRWVDLATFGWPRAFLTSFLPSNVWNKTLNSLDLQESLNKNLKAIEKLNKESSKLSDDELIKRTRAIFIWILEQSNWQ